MSDTDRRLDHQLRADLHNTHIRALESLSTTSADKAH